MGLKALYHEQMEELRRGRPFVTSTGFTVYLLPAAAQEWRRHDVRQSKAVWKYRDMEWFDWPEEVLDQRDLAEFVTGVIDWDVAVAGEPCTIENRTRAAKELPPLLQEVVAEIRRRRTQNRAEVAALGKGSAGSSPSGSSTETTSAPTDTPSSAMAETPASST